MKVRLRFLDDLIGDLRQVGTQGSFARNTAFAFGGTALVVLSQLLLTPFIARIYGPEAYGIYGLFLNLCMNLALVADLGYSNAYALPKDEERMVDLLRGNLLLLLIVMLALVPFCVARDSVYQWIPSWSGMGGWFYLLPLGVAVQFLPTLLTSWLLRAKAFGRSSTLGGTTNIVLRLFNLVYGWATRGALHGLLLGEVLVRGISIAAYWQALRPHGIRRLLHDWNWKRIRQVQIEYRNYPRYIFPERWVALFSLQLPIFLLSGDPVAVGQFTMASALLLLPLRLFGFSMGGVFKQKAADTYHQDPTDLARITSKFFDRLQLIALLPFSVMTAFGDHIFHLFLGRDWIVSGVYASWLAGFFYYRMLSEPIIGLMNVHGREMHQLVFQVGLTVVRLIALALGIFVLHSANAAILGYAVVSTLTYLGFSGYLLNLAGVNWSSRTWRSFAFMAFAVLALLFVRRTLFGTWWPTV